MAVAIAARTGAASVVERKTAVHIDITGLEANVGVVTPKTISSNTLADPTVVTTSAPHGLETGDHVTIAGSNSTPTIDGARVATVTGASTFTVPVNVSVAGTAGTVSFVSDDDSLAAGTERRYYILVDAPSGVDDARSHVFQPSSDGKHSWDDYIFPEDGSYTIKVMDMADDELVASQAVTVTT
jgi:hypothetical protein